LKQSYSHPPRGGYGKGASHRMGKGYSSRDKDAEKEKGGIPRTGRDRGNGPIDLLKNYLFTAGERGETSRQGGYPIKGGDQGTAYD